MSELTPERLQFVVDGETLNAADAAIKLAGQKHELLRSLQEARDGAARYKELYEEVYAQRINQGGIREELEASLREAREQKERLQVDLGESSHATVLALRAALIQIGRKVGALLADGVSTQFLISAVPEEVSAKISTLENGAKLMKEWGEKRDAYARKADAEIETLQASLQQAQEALRKIHECGSIREAERIAAAALSEETQ